MTKSSFYVSPGLTLEERAEKISNKPCYCADPEATTSCATCFALAHLRAAVEESVDRAVRETSEVYVKAMKELGIDTTKSVDALKGIMRR